MLPHILKDLFKKDKVQSQIVADEPTISSLKQAASHKLTISSSKTITLIGEDVEVMKDIRAQTLLHNRDNLSRTNAYLQFFKRNPEIHWAFLAHLVSRNGGYHMTDLKGGLVEHVLSVPRKKSYFSFLERANALIFHDAYPQLLLYEKSKQRKKNLFHLLPAFHVSVFMQIIWSYYMQVRNDSLLTLALIINEQHYIDQRVIHHPTYQKDVMDTWQFTLQELLGFTRVLLPYYDKQNLKLTGVTVQQFDSVNKRIHVGKMLYSLLFSHSSVFKGAAQFANMHTHTASRSDYAPDFFSTSKKEKRIYSPSLQTAWPIVHHSFFDQHDWFNHISIMDELRRMPMTNLIDLTNEYMSKLTPLLLLSREDSDLM
ncbi:DUF2515 family protein [Metabacillus iocasae]|uniref:DUF2515 domain-containing protein n=1 Tax=Priestia iocasae TaxID=2291674 RepID=A0ABS2QVE5_9BACI|nr:DUF2515 family protein [Metabacillus iocasae]MBM7703173.1 hypothetical protein [Metabacillus iocasae]